MSRMNADDWTETPLYAHAGVHVGTSPSRATIRAGVKENQIDFLPETLLEPTLTDWPYLQTRIAQK